MGHLQGKTAIITGGGRAVLSDGSCGSIGYGIATAYAKEGANLVITGRNVKKLEDAKEELERLYGIKVLPVAADVSAGSDNETAVQNVVKQAVDTFGRIDVLINNAQASASGVTLEDHTTEQFDLAVYSGLYAVFYYMKACYPYLKETKGSVINFASGAGLFGNFGQCAYAAAKEGIRGLTRVAATEWGPDGINVIRMDQKRHSAGCFAVSVTWGRCNPVRKTLLIQKLMEHHALCVIVKENIIADMFIFFFHFLINCFKSY